MSLRVIAGTAKGRRLKRVPGDSTRPIMDRVKEALFSIIGPEIVGTYFLDLFAGTGSVGIEALSRGAEAATFIELDRKALQTIYTNLEITGLKEGATVRKMDAFSLLKQTPEIEYDYVYIAPPQYKDIWWQILQALDDNPEWLDPDGIVIVQIDPKEYKDNIILKNMREYDQRKYGKTLLVFYDRMDETTEE